LRNASRNLGAPGLRADIVLAEDGGRSSEATGSASSFSRRAARFGHKEIAFAAHEAANIVIHVPFLDEVRSIDPRKRRRDEKRRVARAHTN
jgi:hypothetical protein